MQIFIDHFDACLRVLERLLCQSIALTLNYLLEVLYPLKLAFQILRIQPIWALCGEEDKYVLPAALSVILYARLVIKHAHDVSKVMRISNALILVTSMYV